jgi:hypothetical protein
LGIHIPIHLAIEGVTPGGPRLQKSVPVINRGVIAAGLRASWNSQQQGRAKGQDFSDVDRTLDNRFEMDAGRLWVHLCGPTRIGEAKNRLLAGCHFLVLPCCRRELIAIPQCHMPSRHSAAIEGDDG